MHRTVLVSLSLALLVLAAEVRAQEPVTPPAQAPAAAQAVAIGPARVAWIDLEQVIMRSEEGKRELADLQQLIEKRTGELKAMQQEGQFLSDQLRVQGDKLKVEAREDLQSQIESKNLQLQRFQEDSQKEVDYRRSRITNVMAKKVIPVVEKIARAKGLSFVLYLNPTLAAFVDPSIIITDEVVTAYNAAYPLPAPKPPAEKKP